MRIRRSHDLFFMHSPSVKFDNHENSEILLKKEEKKRNV